MEQKNFAMQHNALPAPWLSVDTELERLEHLIGVLDDCGCRGIPDAIAQSLDGLEGLKLAAAAMTIVLTDYGGTTPSKTCKTIADELPDLFVAFGQERVLALCEEIQQSELPGQSALFQKMFDSFNDLYLEGRLPYYKILVVYDVRYWETQHCGNPPSFSPSAYVSAFIDFPAWQIFIRFLANSSFGFTMPPILVHQMAHVATDVGHGENWIAEMTRLRRLGAPMDKWDFGPCRDL
jgi:hypothetical protein